MLQEKSTEPSCLPWLGLSGFCLPLLEGHGGAQELVQCTMQIINDFCTPSHGRPCSAKEWHSKEAIAPPARDEDVFEHMVKIVEYFNADCDGAESLAGKMLTGKSKFMTEMPEVITPLIAGWDLAHAFRRVTSRPWASDEFVKDVFQTFISDPKSIVRIIQNSPEFKSWFLENKKKFNNGVGKDFSNLSFRGHRMDSTSKPIARAVMDVWALVATANQIALVRKGKEEGVAAARCLRRISVWFACCLPRSVTADTSIKLTKSRDRRRSNHASNKQNPITRQVSYLDHIREDCDVGHDG